MNRPQIGAIACSNADSFSCSGREADGPDPGGAGVVAAAAFEPDDDDVDAVRLSTPTKATQSSARPTTNPVSCHVQANVCIFVWVCVWVWVRQKGGNKGIKTTPPHRTHTHKDKSCCD